MFKELIHEDLNGVKTIRVAEHKRNLVTNESNCLYRLIVTKLPDRNDVSLFISNIYKGLSESTIIINKEEALKVIYALKAFLNISNDDIPTIDGIDKDKTKLSIINKESYIGISEGCYKTFHCSNCNYGKIYITDNYCSNCGSEIKRCLFCVKELKYNCPRLGHHGGYVHKDTGKLECEPPEDEDKYGFVTTTLCGDKLGKQVRLTEKKHNQFGYYKEGSILTIADFHEKHGYCAGVLTDVKHEYPISDLYSVRPVYETIVTIGWSGFDFID
jgi:hypothetical protein